MNRRISKILLNALFVLVILAAVYMTVCIALYEKFGGTKLEACLALIGAVLLPIIIMDVIIWFNIKKHSDAAVFFSDIVQLVVSAVSAYAIFALTGDIEHDFKYIAVWIVSMLVSIFVMIFQIKRR